MHANIMKIIIYLLFILIFYPGLKADELYIIYTSNINGTIENCGCGSDPLGGIDRVKSFIDKFETENKNIYIIDGGDYFNSYPYPTLNDAMSNALFLINYDCIVPGSGGKDSTFTAHILKYKYGMHPLTVTWAPHIYTEVGWNNFQKWMQSGFDNILFTPNGKVHRLLTRLAFENLLHPFQPFIVGQRHVGPRFSALYGIPLVFYGENQAEYGNCRSDHETTVEREGEKTFPIPGPLDLTVGDG